MAYPGLNLPDPLHSWSAIGSVASIDPLKLAHPVQHRFWDVVEHLG